MSMERAFQDPPRTNPSPGFWAGLIAAVIYKQGLPRYAYPQSLRQNANGRRAGGKNKPGYGAGCFGSGPSAKRLGGYRVPITG